MIEELVLMAMVAHMVLVCGLIWKVIQMNRIQQNTIFGVSHVWGAVKQVENILKNGNHHLNQEDEEE